MKKISSSIAACTLISAFFVIAPVAIAAQTVTTMVTQKAPIATEGALKPATAEASAATKIEYELPYPGLLPDSPLYFLKQFRDWLLEKLVADPVKKTEFYILQGDKRLVMGQMLGQSGNVVLGEQIISKGEKYMNNAVGQLRSMKSQGKDMPAYIVDHITKSLGKHAEVIQAELGKAGDAQKAGLSASLNLVTQLQGELSKLK